MITARHILERLQVPKDKEVNKLEVSEPDKQEESPSCEILNYLQKDWGTSSAKTAWEESNDNILRLFLDDSQSRFLLFINTLPRDTVRHTSNAYTIHLKVAGNAWPLTLFKDFMLNEPASNSLEEVLSRLENLSKIAREQGSVGIGFPNLRSKNLKPQWIEKSRIIGGIGGNNFIPIPHY
jgi:hypothetical protein